MELKVDNPSAHVHSGAHRGGGSAVSVGSHGSQRRRRKTPSTTGSEDSRQSSQLSSRRGSLKSDGDKGPRDPARRVTFTDGKTVGTNASGAAQATAATKKNAPVASQSNQEVETQRTVNSAPAPLNMSRTMPDAAKQGSPPSSPNLPAVAGVAGPAKSSSDARSHDQYSDYGGSDHAYSLDAFVMGDRLVPNPLQDAVGQAPEGWVDATSTPRGTDPKHGAVSAFPSWFYEYDAWLTPRGSVKSSPLVLMVGIHGCACGCCGCCGCICGNNAGGGTGTSHCAVASQGEV